MIPPSSAYFVRLIGLVALVVGGWLAFAEFLRDPAAPAHPVAPIGPVTHSPATSDPMLSETAKRTMIAPQNVGSTRKLVLHATDGKTGHSIAEVKILQRLSVHAESGHGREIARTAEDGTARISIDSTHPTLECVAEGYAPAVITLLPRVDEYIAHFFRSGLLRGTIRLPGGDVPVATPRVIAYPPGSELQPILDCLHASGWFSCVSCQTHVTETDASGAFSIESGYAGHEYELAVVGGGLVSTARTTTAMTDGNPVVIPVAYAYAARVEASNQWGERIFLFSPGTNGAIGGVTWRFHGAIDPVRITNSSLFFSDAAPVIDRGRGSRAFVGTSRTSTAVLGEIVIDTALPGYRPTSIVAPLQQVGAGVAEYRATIVQAAICLGSVRIRFTPESEASVPQGRLRLRRASPEEVYEIPIHPSMLDQNRSCLVRGLPCGEYSAFIRWEISRKCAPSEDGVNLLISADGKPTEMVIDTSDVVNLTVHVAGEGIEERLHEGLYIGIGDEERNSKVTDGAGMRFGEFKPMRSDAHVFDGLAVGRYCLLLQSASEGVIAFDWIDVSESGTEVTLVAESKN